MRKSFWEVRIGVLSAWETVRVYAFVESCFFEKGRGKIYEQL